MREYLKVLLAKAARGQGGKCCDPAGFNHSGNQLGSPVAGFVFTDEYLHKTFPSKTGTQWEPARDCIFLVCKSCLKKGYIGSDSAFEDRVRRLSEDEWTVWVVMHS